MRICCFSQCDNLSSGVGKKISSQVAALREIGQEAELFVCEKTVGTSAGPESAYTKIRTFPTSDNRFLGLIQKYGTIAGLLDEQIGRLGDGDILYLRFLPPTPFLWYTLRKPRECRVISEHQSIERKEVGASGKYGYLILDTLFGRAVRKHLDGFVGMTPEITAYQVRRSGDRAKPHATVGNGIHVHAVPLRRPVPFTGDRLVLLFVGNTNIWHGVDRVIEGLALSRPDVRATLHIAGEGTELPGVRRLIEEMNVPVDVVFHGYLAGKALDRLFDEAHVGIGSLGIHRIGLTQAITLKAGEYCARGLPFVIGYDDTNFAPDFPYALRVPSGDHPVDIGQVFDFAEKVHADPDHHAKMRTYADGFLDWKVKMFELKEFFNSLNGGR